MSSELNKAAKCYGLYDEGNIVAFCAVLHQPHPSKKNLKRVSRIVVLPDYQGIGIGYKFLTFLAKKYTEEGYNFSIVTSAKNFIKKLQCSNEWRCIRYGKTECSSKKNAIDYKRKTIRTNCKTASFVYKI